MTPPVSGPIADRWGDLRTRVLSAIVMLVLGIGGIWLGGVAFGALVVVLSALMIWELAVMTAPRAPQTAIGLGIVTAASLAATVTITGPYHTAFLVIPPLMLALTPRSYRAVALAYGAAIVLAGYGLISLRNGLGMPAILWLIGVVIVSDVMGYFAGRMLGGPKFWPAISPKKTWSGTVAGWIGAAIVGLGFVWAGAGWGLVILSPVISFAGQMGDIAESWIKRHTGVKDSSHLIPGHGGVLDRFDAVIGAVVVVMLLAQFLPLPLPAGH